MKDCDTEECPKQAIVQVNLVNMCMTCLKKYMLVTDGQRCTTCNLHLKICICQHVPTQVH